MKRGEANSKKTCVTYNVTSHQIQCVSHKYERMYNLKHNFVEMAEDPSFLGPTQTTNQLRAESLSLRSEIYFV
jgi:hypothetical protein